MPYYEIINNFMVDKARRIDDHKMDRCKIKYYSSSDYAAILKWEREKAKTVVIGLTQGIEFTLKNLGMVYAFSHRTCPFCIANNFKGRMEDVETSCSKCDYAKRHGPCHEDDSDYMKLQRSEVLWEPIYEILDRRYLHEQFEKLKGALNKYNESDKTRKSKKIFKTYC
jgi:hypothetical protein